MEVQRGYPKGISKGDIGKGDIKGDIGDTLLNPQTDPSCIKSRRSDACGSSAGAYRFGTDSRIIGGLSKVSPITG
jgi:hypothetical protein